MPLRLAVVSDMHCHHSSAKYSETLFHSDLPRRPQNQHPVEALGLLIEQEQLRADVLLMPGDMTNRADAQGISTAWDYIVKVGSWLRAGVCASTLGNHDVIYKDDVDDSFKLARDLLPQFPTSVEDQFRCFWGEGWYVEEQPDYRIVVVNTVQHQTNETAAKRGLVSTAQIEAIDRFLCGVERKAYQIGLCHHHPIQHEEIDLGPTDLMVNGSLLVAMLSKHGFNLLVHGHKHHPRLRIESSGGSPIAVFASGSFSAGMRLGLATRARNVFHLIELDSTSLASASVKGTIRTWQFQHQRGWTKATRDAADFPHLTGFGSSSTASHLAQQIESEFRALSKDVERWSVIADKVPDIDLIPPAEFSQVGQLLLERGLTLSPKAPDRPEYIGIPG